ncbi:MAG: hypothetical protein HY811_04785 [Planctomycetes bacterium]|nr:hypothetical protein [Planctomycetota bacterium]
MPADYFQLFFGAEHAAQILDEFEFLGKDNFLIADFFEKPARACRFAPGWSAPFYE